MAHHRPPVPRSLLEPKGPWTPRRISAAGASFHVADAGPQDSEHVVVLLHDFPFFWWSFHEVIPLLSEAGHRVVALDLRGFGTSDLQRDDPDLTQLARDVTAVVSAMGIAQFSVVGVGLGGAVAWMIGAQDPVSLRSVTTVVAPHPLAQPSRGISSLFSGGALLALRLEIPLRRIHLLENGKLVDGMLRTWAAPANRASLVAGAGRYRAALTRSFAASAAVDSAAAARHLSLAARRALATTVKVPVLSVHGGQDSFLRPTDYHEDARWVSGRYSARTLHGCGHFPPEEDPAGLAAEILRQLSSVPPREH
ncbi:MAG: alpha/beta hydrolase [Actinomyces sp.]|nr:alpha/beta hydrolase [Actinomyces sp.]